MHIALMCLVYFSVVDVCHLSIMLELKIHHIGEWLSFILAFMIFLLKSACDVWLAER